MDTLTAMMAAVKIEISHPSSDDEVWPWTGMLARNVEVLTVVQDGLSANIITEQDTQNEEYAAC